MIVMIIPRQPCLTCKALRVTEWLVENTQCNTLWNTHTTVGGREPLLSIITEKLTGI